MMAFLRRRLARLIVCLRLNSQSKKFCIFGKYRSYTSVRMPPPQKCVRLFSPVT